jgi:Fe-S-cluster containining protein
MVKIIRDNCYHCSSGKEYEGCLSLLPDNTNGEANFVNLNRNTAYKGRIGHLRESFCIDFIRKKTEAFKEIYKNQKDIVGNEPITCRKGCSNCCTLCVGCSIQEGESIVYHLYQNKDKLDNFLKKYPIWRNRLKRHENLFNKELPNSAINTSIAGGLLFKIIDDFAEYEYSCLGIPCPFLNDGVCSIYDVRPFVCAGLITTTPSEYCNPLSKKKAKAYQISNDFLLKDQATYSFYGRNLKSPVWSIMPIMVYNILEYGLPWIISITEMEDLLTLYINNLGENIY